MEIDYGQNGFYLDFDPTTGGGYLADKSGNGNDFTESTGRNTIEVTAPDTPGSDNSTSLGLDDVSAISIGDYITEVGNGDDGKGTVAFVDDTLKRIYLDANEPNWDVGSYIKNDTIISIGTDASGQGNHFTDENFAVGNTDEVWSNYLVTSDDFMTNRGPDKGFDGNPSTICHGGVANATLTFDPGVTITGTEITFTTAYATEISFKDSTQNIAIPGADGVNGAASVTITIPGGEFTGFSVVNNEPTKGTSFNTVSVDGQLLIDKNIQDTVKDTPMRNYAVLENG